MFIVMVKCSTNLETKQFCQIQQLIFGVHACRFTLRRATVRWRGTAVRAASGICGVADSRCGSCFSGGLSVCNSCYLVVAAACVAGDRWRRCLRSRCCGGNHRFLLPVFNFLNYRQTCCSTKHAFFFLCGIYKNVIPLVSLQIHV